MYFIAHSDTTTVANQSLAHIARENSLKIVFITFIFIALTYLAAILFIRATARTATTPSSHHKHKESEDHE